MKLQRIIGDATKPVGDGNKLIIHICNDIGGWGAGFVLALSQAFPDAERAYLNWYHGEDQQPKQQLQVQKQIPFTLGQVQFVSVTPQITVCNMIAQRHVTTQNGTPPIRYDALAECLQKVASFAKENQATVHFPKISCGLAGGEWNKIEPLLQAFLLDQEIQATLYELS